MRGAEQSDRGARRAAARCAAAALGAVLAFAACAKRPAAPSAAEPNEETRLAAREYVRAVPIRETLQEAVLQMAADRGVADTGAWARTVLSEVRIPVLEQATGDALARHFTAAEIRALAEFNARPEARGIQRKMPAYLADVSPVIGAELARVLSMTNAAMACLRWATRLQSFKAAIGDDRIVAFYPFMNRGPDTVTITNVQTSCGCAAAKLTQTTYRPGEGGGLEMTYVFEDRVGPQTAVIRVGTDDPREPVAELRAEIDIPLVATVDPLVALWRVGEAAAARRIEVRPGPGRAFDIASWKAGGDLFECRLAASDPGRGGAFEVRPRHTASVTGDVLRVSLTVEPGIPKEVRAYLVVTR